MYKECRHILPNGQRCRSAALAKCHWCYYHSRLHRQEDRRKAGLRATDGRFRPQTEAEKAGRRSPAAAIHHPAPAEEQIIDHGIYPVAASAVDAGAAPAPSPGWPIPIPAIEDNASIQLALIEVLHALAANQLDTKRAGLLLYGLQVAAQNVKHLHIHQDEVRSVTYAANGSPLSKQELGYDIEDMGCDDEDEDEDQDQGDDQGEEEDEDEA